MITYISKLEKIDEEELEMIEMSSDQRKFKTWLPVSPITEDMDGMKLVVAQDI